MGTMQQRQSGWRAVAMQELATLAFITRGGNWFFLLLSRLAEPLMFLSVLYVIAETVLPDVFKAHILVTISGACVIVLNLAPEVIMPGAFILSRRCERQQAWMYKAMCVVFLLLAFVTLAAFIWKYPHDAVSVILFARCSAGILYSLLVRVSLPQTSTTLSISGETPAPTSSLSDETVQLILEKLARLDAIEQAVNRPVIVEQVAPPVALIEAPETPAPISETPVEESETGDLHAQLERLLVLVPEISTRQAASIVGKPTATVGRHIKLLRQTA